jgi:serine/threonine-protein kinase
LLRPLIGYTREDVREAGTKSIPLKALTGGRPFPTERELKEGLRLGRYELLVPIARGGMAEVWIARLLGDLGFSRIVAVKTIRPEYAEDPAFRSSFFEEARLAARLRHANLVEVFDLGEEGPILFQAMTLIEGDSVSKLLRSVERLEGPGFLPPIATRIMVDALAGLHAAHELTDEEGVPMQLVHRDVSPHNILVGVDGVSKLCDFGVAKALGRVVNETDRGQLRGKFGYLSPEQVERKPIDRRSDLFAAGAVLWEMITGKPLFRGADVMETLASVTTSEIPDPRSVVKTRFVPDSLAEATLKALARDPKKRFQSAAEMIDALEPPGARARASNKDVSDFVSRLCGPRIEAQREAIRRVGRGILSVEPVQPMSNADFGAPPPATKEAVADALRRPAAAPRTVSVRVGQLGTVAGPPSVVAGMPMPIGPPSVTLILRPLDVQPPSGDKTFDPVEDEGEATRASVAVGPRGGARWMWIGGALFAVLAAVMFGLETSGREAVKRSAENGAAIEEAQKPAEGAVDTATAVRHVGIEEMEPIRPSGISRSAPIRAKAPKKKVPKPPFANPYQR